tara:strand:+ start:75 stop:287 length:213 start_codon:yes stop_codon:yes gene_type:complete
MFLRKIFLSITFNFSLFLLLMIGIQNSSNQSKVNLIFNESVKLPIGFILGVSFISGSLTANILQSNLKIK